jgi:hypothetical protein
VTTGIPLLSYSTLNMKRNERDFSNGYYGCELWRLAYRREHMRNHYFISFSSLSYDRSKASSKASSPHSAIQSFLFQMRVSSPFLKVMQ